jgi:hypothetical protein
MGSSGKARLSSYTKSPVVHEKFGNCTLSETFGTY